MTSAPGNFPPSETGGGFHPGRLRRDDPEVEVRKLARVGLSAYASGEIVPPGDGQPFLVERPCVLLPAREHGDVRNGCEMGGEEAADRSRADDAHPHANFAWRYSRYGPASSSEPVMRRSSSLAGYLLPCR